jgi:NAD(P)-dependent dehydrogenase (short-subunit alcohol dehydrogenase family)
VFRKVWEMACYSGFLAGREAARLMLPRGQGNIFFTGATASLRGGSGYAAFASAKFRPARRCASGRAGAGAEKNIHVAHLIIDPASIPNGCASGGSRRWDPAHSTTPIC